ncbi:MAG: sigma-70 family RNA polymerase sigma factor [Gemmatimonadota bacterium]|nr:sigma-70 family RNA polymerase sigma factor [Gemmatimonadota bacterium]
MASQASDGSDLPDGSELPDGSDLPDLPANEAVGELFRSHGDRIYSLGLRLCGSPDGAEELVQETFMRALRAWDSFEGRSKPTTWLYTIASRACGRMRRLRAGQPRTLEPLERLLPSGQEGIIQIPSDDDPEASVERNEAVDAIVSSVTDLPLEFRLPFVLKEIAGLSVVEIAEALGVKPATVKTRLHRARLRVRQAVAEALPAIDAPPVDRRREECLVLLHAKLEAMDRDAPFPLSQGHLCERCRSVFQSLDYMHDTCVLLQSGTMPDSLRTSLAEALEGS